MKKLGQVQIFLAIVLAVIAVAAWATYRQSARKFFMASACVSDSGKEIASLLRQQVHDSRQVAEAYAETCASAQKAIDTVKSTYSATKQQIPGIQKMVRDISGGLQGACGITTTIGNKVNIRVPSGVYMKGWVPALSYSQPLEGVKDSALQLAAQMQNAQTTLTGFDKDVLAKLADPNDQVPVTLDKTQDSLRLTESALRTMAGRNMPEAEKRMQEMENRLKAASVGIDRSIYLFDGIIALILVMSAAFLVNGIIVTRLAVEKSGVARA